MVERDGTPRSRGGVVTCDGEPVPVVTSLEARRARAATRPRPRPTFLAASGIAFRAVPIGEVARLLVATLAG